MNRFPLLLFLLVLLSSAFVSNADNIFALDQVEINTASLEELDKITGIGPALGQRIINGRPYSSIDDLLRVKGIGEKTLQKIKDQGLAYVEGQSINPTPVVASPTPTIASPTPTLEAEPLKIFGNILINEIMPSPQGADDQNEWIKLINSNDFEINLSGWSIKDIEGKTTTYVFPKNTIIPANGSLTLTRPQTKISLNNDKDGLELIKPDGTIADSVRYKKAPTGQSYIRNGDKWQWSNALSKEKEPTSAETIENPFILQNQASVKLSLTENHPDIYAWIVAVFTAICSSAVILFLKLKLKGVDKEEFLS